MPPRKRKAGGDLLKCGTCDGSYSDLEEFIAHKKQCQEEVESAPAQEHEKSPSPSREPPKKRGRPSKSEIAERQKRLEAEKLEGACKECDGCKTTEDCQKCVPCQRKLNSEASDEKCIMRICEKFADDSDVLKAIGEASPPKVSEEPEPAAPTTRLRKARQSKSACTDFLKRISSSAKSPAGKDESDFITAPKRNVPSILRRRGPKASPATTTVTATSFGSSDIAAAVESARNILIVTSDHLPMLHGTPTIIQEADELTQSDGERQNLSAIRDRISAALSSPSKSGGPKYSDLLTADQRKILAKRKGRSKIQTTKPRKNRIFVVADDGVIIDVVGTASADRFKAVERADEKMPYVREKMAIIQNTSALQHAQPQPAQYIQSSIKPELLPTINNNRPSTANGETLKKDFSRTDAIRKRTTTVVTPQSSGIALEDCMIDVVDMTSMQKLPNQIQLVESDLPLAEAENIEGLTGNYLFRQIYTSQDPMKCLLCKEKFTFKFLVDLEKHYHVIHEIQAITGKAEFSDNAVFICLPDDVTEETLLKSACQFCDATLRTLAEVREHYTTMHERTIRHVYEGQLSNLSQLLFCTLCNSAAESFDDHREHMKTAHHRVTFVCKYCNYCTPRPGRLKAHVKQRHVDGQPGPHLQCTVCSVYVHGKERLMKHVLLSHAVQTGPSLWSCAKCLEGTSSHDELLKHIAECPDLQKKEAPKPKAPSESGMMYKCSNCEQVFQDKEDIEKHMLEAKCMQEFGENDAEGLDESATTCFLCNVTFKNAELTNNHLHHVHMKWVKRTVKSADNSPEVATQICPLNDATEIIMDPSAMLAKEEVPNETRLQTMSFPTKVGHYCHLCDVVIKNYTLFYLHMHNLHGMQKRFVCIVTNCSNTFEDPMMFQIHCKVHNQRGEHFCAMCDMIFDTSEDLQEHFVSAQHATQHMKIQDKHNRTEPRNYRCRVCHTWHGLLSTFIRHMETESHQYQCQHCGQLFVQPAPRRNHIQNSHPEMANICEICGAKASSPQALWSHLSQHSVVHDCNKCHRRFLQKEQLAAHMEIHAPPTPCPWEGCTRRLSTKVGLFNHMRLHRGECDYKCPMCERGFFKKKSLDIHLKSHEISSAGGSINANSSLMNARGILKNRQGPSGAPVEIRLICSGCCKGFDGQTAFENHQCVPSEQYILDANGQAVQQIQSGLEGDSEAVYITEGGGMLATAEGTVSIKKDLDRGVATISIREDGSDYSLEVEGGREGIEEIDENIALQLLRAAGGDDVTHLQVEDNGRTTQYRILKCTTCNKGFFKEKSLDEHMRSHLQEPTITRKQSTTALPGASSAGSMMDVRLFCSGCAKAFDGDVEFNAHPCVTGEQLMVDGNGQTLQIQNNNQQPEAEEEESEAVMMTDGNNYILSQEGVVNIRRDPNRGVAVISVREGATQFSLEVEGGKDGINEIDENIAIQLLRAAGGDDVTHLQVEDNGKTTQYKIIKYQEQLIEETDLVAAEDMLA